MFQINSEITFTVPTISTIALTTENFDRAWDNLQSDYEWAIDTCEYWLELAQSEPLFATLWLEKFDLWAEECYRLQYLVDGMNNAEALVA